MTMLSPALESRLFVLGLCLSSCAIFEGMRRMLIHYRDLARIPPSPDEPSYIDQAIEDNLKLSTLQQLLESPNYGIQETATVIICERALHDEKTIDTLLWNITRPDHDVREQGIRALIMVMNSSTGGLINTLKTYSAVVKSLEYCVTDYDHNDYHPAWDNWHLRDIVERSCLLFIAQLIMRFKYDALDGLIRYRFIQRWLSKEPWGGRNIDERQLNFMDHLSKETRVSSITLELFKYPPGRSQMEKLKLIPPPPPEEPLSRDVRMLYEGNVVLTDQDDIAAEDFEGMFVRQRGQSAEEEHTRRRHREAMVLNDGMRPVSRDDIIERAR